jgi:serine kinase of HPr protein (carbohydrate metabolism regulator)
MTPTVHASAVLVGATAVLIRGPAGAGKSRVVMQMLTAAQVGLFKFARLVADDRVVLTAAHGRLIARPPPELAGLIEVRGLGIHHMTYEPAAVVSLVLDLADNTAERMPGPGNQHTEIAGITLPRVSAGPGVDPLLIVAAALETLEQPIFQRCGSAEPA